MPDLNKSYQWAINTCNAPNVGYSMSPNLRGGKTQNGITYYDCSSFIYFALKAGGFAVPSYVFSTSTMLDSFPLMGFTQVPIEGEWKSGDICHIYKGQFGRAYGHTEMVYSGGLGKGITMGAHGNVGIALPNQVSINNYESSYPSFTTLWRYGNGGALNYGVSIYVICALAGNAWQETHINPLQPPLTSGSSAVGMFMWTGSRATYFRKWLEENNYELSNGNANVEYLIKESEYIGQEVWVNTFGEYNTTQEFINSNSTDIPYLTECFARCWERPYESDLNLISRVTFANDAFNYIMLHAQDSTITSWIAKTTMLSREEALNNAVMMFRYLSTGGGGGSLRTKHGMPVYMMLKNYKRR